MLTLLRNNTILNIFLTCLILLPLSMLKNKDPENKTWSMVELFSGRKRRLTACFSLSNSHLLILVLISKKQFILTTEPSCHYWNQNLWDAMMHPAKLTMAQLPQTSRMNWLILLPSIHVCFLLSLLPGAQWAGCTLEPLKGVLLPLSQSFLADRTPVLFPSTTLPLTVFQPSYSSAWICRDSHYRGFQPNGWLRPWSIRKNLGGLLSI